MTEILMQTERPKYTNTNLQHATDRVFKLGETVRKCAYETAHIMATVDRLECYKDDGFNNVHEWAMQTFGFKKSTSYTLLKVGKEYTRVIERSRGAIYESNLLPENTSADFTTSQIEKMLPGGHDLAIELVESEEITPDMTCKQIEKIIKSHLEPEEVEPEEVEPEEAEPEEVEPEEVYIIMYDIENREYKIPLEIAEQYRIS